MHVTRNDQIATCVGSMWIMSILTSDAFRLLCKRTTKWTHERKFKKCYSSMLSSLNLLWCDSRDVATSIRGHGGTQHAAKALFGLETKARKKQLTSTAILAFAMLLKCWGSFDLIPGTHRFHKSFTPIAFVVMINAVIHFFNAEDFPPKKPLCFYGRYERDSLHMPSWRSLSVLNDAIWLANLFTTMLFFA